MTEGCGCARPVGLSLPTAKSTEGKPQEWAAGRDAVRTAETREATAADEILPILCLNFFLNVFLTVSVPNANAQSNENAQPTGTISGRSFRKATIEH